MDLPPLYKYLDVQGAKLTLANGTFKHAKPSDFNDIEDLTVRSIFSVDVEEALDTITKGFVDVLLANLNRRPTCSSPMREKVAMIQHALRGRPVGAALIKWEFQKRPVYDAKYMRERSEEFIRTINRHMQDYRILCVTTLNQSEHMWDGYAQNHKGIALRIEPNISADSKFTLFRPVKYTEARPAFYNDPLEFISDTLFANQETRIARAIEKIVYTKTLRWSCESEYRLAIPLRPGEDWNTDPYRPEEITELYLGLAMADDTKKEIIALARSRNPKILVFQAYRGSDTGICFKQY